MHAQAGRGVDLDHAAVLLFERAQHVLADHVDAADVAGRPSAPQRPRARPLRGARRRSRRWRCRRWTGWRCCAGSRAGPARGTMSGCQALRLPGGRRRCRRSGSWSARWRGRRRGAGRWLTMSTSSRTVCTPSPITCGGSRRAAATSLSPTTSRRKSMPGRNFSTMTLADIRRRPSRRRQSAARGVVMLTVTPLPWLPSCGLTTTGRPISCAAAQASSASLTGAAQRHRHAGGVEQLLGQFLVLRDRLGDAAGAVDFGGLDAALLGSPSRTAPGCRWSGGGTGCRAPPRHRRSSRCSGRGARLRRGRAVR